MVDNLASLFDAHHRLDANLVRSLTPDELDSLRSIVRGNQRSADRVRALEALGMRGTSDFGQSAEELLVRPDEQLPIRASAATLLARWLGPLAEPIILGALDQTRDELLLIKLSGALARIGGQAALGALNELLNSSNDHLRRQASFALVMIGHRLNLTSSALRRPAPSELTGPPISPWRDFTLARVSEAEYEAATPQMTFGDAFGLSPARDMSFTIHCGRVTSLLLLGPGRFNELATTAITRPLFLGVVADRRDIDGSYSVGQTVLVGPLELDTFYIAIYRIDGTELHFGSGSRRNGSLSIRLESLIATGAPILDVRGTVEAQNIKLQIARSANSNVAPSTPRRR